MISIIPANVGGLDDTARYQFSRLVNVYNLHSGKNIEKNKYY